MKVFAEYIKDNDIEYRQKTVLQFGDSWELIGSAVLKNPGSAEPKDKIDELSYAHIKDIFKGNYQEIENWYTFSTDATMRYLAKIFNGSYIINNTHDLNGVIVLYNLFYIKDSNVQSAINKLEDNNSNLLYPSYSDLALNFNHKPVYLGWKNECYTNDETLKLSMQIFEYVSNSNSMYLNNKFEDNMFYHPMGIHFWLSRKPEMKEMLINFSSFIS